ncbi:hypothetical protein RchiOBHm_Chr2g0107251 [Rosa chinensis]|uniref:Uncharacterized protein n=1 Tax=Rosa chinensis TaxID=74649 RepID=A0A2P6RNW9_ROSCH|nr:hypothetical protein RchiOBHm_Chr2g0107251 [Rosa chinensis]
MLEPEQQVRWREEKPVLRGRRLVWEQRWSGGRFSGCGSRSLTSDAGDDNADEGER